MLATTRFFRNINTNVSDLYGLPISEEVEYRCLLRSCW